MMTGHQSVLLEKAVDALVLDPGGFYVDGTFGRGGHSAGILDRLDKQGRLLVIDKDPAAVAAAMELGEKDPRVLIRQGSFAGMNDTLAELGQLGRVSGVLLDLGVSSPQLDDAERGFSFSKDGPLDMRMNPQEGVSAARWLATAGQQEIADVLYHYGEERYARRIARAIVRARQQCEIDSTGQLAEIIRQAIPAREKHKHPATRSFQAIRIKVNNELEELEQGLAQILEALAVGGRLVVISFHSLEDRLVKTFIRQQERGDDYPRGVPVTAAELRPRLRRVGRAVKVDAGEVDRNIRARSAVMRVAEKIA